VNPEIQDLYNDLEKEIENKIRYFIDKKQKELELNFEKELKKVNSIPMSTIVAKDNPQPATIPTPAANSPKNQEPKNLPWFANGIKGFLRKLWHGNSKSNPDWSMSECVTLEEYSFIRSELEEILMETEMLKSDDIRFLVSDLMITIRTYIERLKKIKRKYNKKDKTNDLGKPNNNFSKPDQEIIIPHKNPSIEDLPTKSTSSNEPIGVSNVKSRREKKQNDVKSNSNPLSFEQMKISTNIAHKMAQTLIKSLDEYNSRFSNDKLTTQEKMQKTSFLKELASKLESVGLEIINNIKVARTRENAVKLVQILKEMSRINTDNIYDWKDIDNYFITFPELIYPNMDQYIKDAISKIENEEVKEEQYLLHQKYEKYLIK